MRVREVFDRFAGEYDAARPRLVPCFDAFYGCVVAELPFPPDGSPRVLDLGAGTGLLALLVARAFPRARLELVDVAPGMLAIARERFAGQDPPFRYSERDYSAEPPVGPYDAVISALSIHHLDAAAKQRLFAHLRACLEPGGVFVNADQVAGESAEEDADNRDRWRREARALGASDAELAAARERMREDKPSTVAQQLGWLEQAGFTDVRAPFRDGMFAVIAARAPS